MRNTSISNNSLETFDKIDEFDDIEMEMSHDRRAVILVVMLSFLCGLTFGILSSSVLADEVNKPMMKGPATEEVKTKSEAKWKPPVAQPMKAPSPIDSEQSKKIMEERGVEILSLQMTAAGYMMDFRFRVLDVEKAKIFFDQKVKPYLHVSKSNAKLPVPMAAKVGAFRATDRGKNIKPNKIYYIVFGNPDAHVKRGEKVTLVLGDYKIEDMTVN
ncbi:MAG: hypothetical protein KZQ77_12015 [Candidatus Thiodiazotropha sp. (ex Notomyrtea botanica)]|nr:hypothetical protein [Candidatus Thiodiazotropha sp. (ex Notomyrtea botanica)]